MGSLDPPMSSSSSSSAYIPEPFSPLFLLSSDVPGVSLVAVPFSGNGFGVISPDIAESVQYSDTAESIWRQLNNRYGTVNRTKVFELKRELAPTYQGSLDIASYFNKLKKIWNELGVIWSSHANSCGCAAKEGLQKEKEEDKVHQFIMGLNEVYVSVRSNLLMMHPLPSLDRVYNILLQGEKQRQSTQPRPQQTLYNQRVVFDQPKSGLFCKYCKKSWNLIDKYYKLNEFPPKFKFTIGRKATANVAVESDFSSYQNVSTNFMSNPTSNQVDQGYVVYGLTQQQYSQLISLLQQTYVSDSGPQFNSLSFAYFAGTLLPKNVVYSFNSSLLSKSDSLTWIVYSGASDHMTSDKDYLINITPLPIPFLVSLPNGYKGPSLKKPLDLGKLDNGLYMFV
uniref:Uncharacterized protein n=1 Tax=Nicotiana tabacum TaxID=4097 RepID=A0A1S3XV48_TOBAC